MQIENDTRLRVLMVIQNLRPGGAERQLIALARGLARRGAEITVACMGAPDTDVGMLTEAGVEVVALGAESREKRLAAVPRLVRLARGADVVQCTMWDASLWGRVAAVIARKPVIVSDHAADRAVQTSSSGAARRDWIARHNRALDRFTFATVACARTQVPLLEEEGVSPERIVYIPNGVPTGELREAAQPPPTRADLGIPEDARVIIHVAQFRPEKNQAATYETVSRLREELGDVDAVFVGVGRAIKDPMERRAAEQGATWAHFLGMRSDVPALFALADLAVLPSSADTMPLSLLEAMALGVPVVATDVGDVRGMVEGAGAGIVVPPDDLDAFVEACRSVLADPELHARLSEAGRQASRAFDSETMVDAYQRLLRAAEGHDRARLAEIRGAPR
ncbi:MAG TPA: glycosyltransferase [Solirubrobacterales bacterium]|jgi:glycosyltransferase involved in cell wall biosynthesis